MNRRIEAGGRRSRVSKGIVVAVGIVTSGLCACTPLAGGAGSRPDGFRLVQGRVQLPDEDVLGRQVTGLQMAAISVEDGVLVDVATSDVFDPSTQRAEAAFVVAVAQARAFSLVLQVPSSSQRGAGAWLATLSFPDGVAEGALVPAGDDDVDVGTLTFTAGASAPAGNALAVSSAARNPLAQIDSDLDGTPDLNDADDDDDGNADASDNDRAGDGLDDGGQGLGALADDDADGIADALSGR